MDDRPTRFPFLARLVNRVGNPLDWSWTDKTLLLLGVVLVVTPLLIANIYLVAGAKAFAVVGKGLFQWGFTAIWAVLFIVGLIVRNKLPKAVWLTYPAFITMTVHASWFVCRSGYATIPVSYLMLFVYVFIGQLLFGYRVALVVFICWVGTLAAHMVLEGMGVIEYAFLLEGLEEKVREPGGLWDMAQMMNGFIAVLICLLICGYIIDRWRFRERQVMDMSELLKKMFGRYLSTEVMNSLIANPAALELGGERRSVTILMSDLRGFTALSERLEPEQVVRLLNSYFEVMVEVILKHDGTISEIIGDALLVVFGAPQDMEDQTLSCVACALEMQNAMTEVNRQNRAMGIPEIEMGIGVNEAEVVVGNIGSSKRSNYTVVGRGVNMVQRIESYSVGGQVLVSDSVKSKAGASLRIDGKREVFPKGAEAPFTIYEVGGVGAPYNITLLDQEVHLHGLARPIPALCTPLDGKQVGRERIPCSLTRLSLKSADLVCQADLELYSNLKLNLAGVSEELAGRDFYAKVLKHSSEDATLFRIRFTSLPSEVDGSFQAAILQSRREDVSVESE
ncbi:MAG: adenylate/guanylate cyclase domain-containing protein [Desulfovibrio sp.]|nr:MAG: adenylate/guanylate cyclase domain-containing protein [Desulfovibrio sp.]